MNEGIHTCTCIAVHTRDYVMYVWSKVFKFVVRKTKTLPECTKIFYFIPETLSSEFYSRLPKEDTIESYKD